MLPQALLLCSVFPSTSRSNGGFSRKASADLVPHYFNERDYPWVTRFYEEFLRFKGGKRREVITFFRGPLPFVSPDKKRALLFHLLLNLSEDDPGLATGKKARAIRRSLFEGASRFIDKPEPSQVL